MTVILLLILSFQSKASYRSEIYSAYIGNRMDLWKKVLERMDSIPYKSNDLLLELVNYQYGYIGYCLGFDRKEESKEYMTSLLENIDILEKNGINPSVINSYKSAYYGFRIALNPISAAVNGTKSLGFAKNAQKLDPDNYLAYVMLGNSEFHTPSALGGSKKEALEYFLNAKELIEKNSASLSDDWNYLSLLIVIGQTHTYLKDYVSAQKVYQGILELEPEFLYVKDDLYPKLLKKMEI